MKVICTGVNYFTSTVYVGDPMKQPVQKDVASATVSFNPISDDPKAPTVASFTLTYQGITKGVDFFPGKEYTLTLEESAVQE